MEARCIRTTRRRLWNSHCHLVTIYVLCLEPKDCWPNGQVHFQSWEIRNTSWTLVMAGPKRDIEMPWNYTSQKLWMSAPLSRLYQMKKQWMVSHWDHRQKRKTQKTETGPTSFIVTRQMARTCWTLEEITRCIQRCACRCRFPTISFGHWWLCTNQPASIQARTYVERQDKARNRKDWWMMAPSRSPWSSPVMAVPKPDGSVCVCVDFRAINKHTKLDRYPLPRIDELFAKVGKAPFLTTLDLSKGYHQVLLAEDTIPSLPS